MPKALEYLKKVVNSNRLIVKSIKWIKRQLALRSKDFHKIK